MMTWEKMRMKHGTPLSQKTRLGVVCLLAGVFLLMIAGCEKIIHKTSNEDFSWGEGFQITTTIQTNLQAGVVVEIERFHEGTNLVFEVECVQSITSKLVVRQERLFWDNQVAAEIVNVSGLQGQRNREYAIKAYGAQGINVVSGVDGKGRIAAVSVETDCMQMLAGCRLKKSRLWPISAQAIAKQNAFTQNLSDTFKGFIEKKDTPEEFLSNIEKLKQELRVQPSRAGHDEKGAENE